jgi:hypothetical protein
MKIVVRIAGSRGLNVIMEEVNVLNHYLGSKESVMNIKTGDIISFSGFGRKSVIVNLVTYGLPYWSASHVGIIGEYKGTQLLFESTTLSNIPCQIQGHSYKGVQAVLLGDRVKSYNGRCSHYGIYRPLFGFEEERLNKFLISKIGVPYDMVGGMRSAGAGVSWIESKLRGEDLSLIFCSELVAAAHNLIGLLRTENASRWNPNKLIRHERHTRTLRRPRRLKCKDFC